MCRYGTPCLRAEAVKLASVFNRDSIVGASTTLRSTDDLASAEAAAAAPPLAPASRSPVPGSRPSMRLRLVSRTSGGVPSMRSTTRPVTRADSRAPNTPSASAVVPAANDTSFCLSVSSVMAAFPRCWKVALMDSRACFRCASSLSPSRRRLTSSANFASFARPSASASAFARATSLSSSAFRSSVILRSAWIASSVCCLRASCFLVLSSCMATVSAFLSRAASCSAPIRLRASSSSYCAS
mmetsp:Transcript_4006/g.10499  ORF Transcript_4006/g.10499 Transcript_4006/m.10499 type:complete len:241 (-) Transcript_4006:280-1002(-)